VEDVMADKTMPVTGGCLCGAVRYESSDPPVDVCYCHCRMCQRSSGNAFGMFASFRRDAFRFTRGEPKLYKSSAFAERGFCAECGTPLIFRYVTLGPLSEEIAVSLGSLDHPEDASPKSHWGIESQMPWLAIHDDLPRIRTEEDPDFIAHSTAADQGKE
jgi:hypothetical protein